MAGDEDFLLAEKGGNEKEASLLLSLPVLVEYDPAEDRERVRGWIALALVGLLAALAIIAFAMLQFHGAPASDIKALLDVLIGPIVGLVGTVTGFYFGQKSNRP